MPKKREPQPEPTPDQTAAVEGRIQEIVMGGKDAKSVKRALRKEFRFLDVELIKDEEWKTEKQKAVDQIGQTLVNRLANNLANLDWWKQLAAKDRDAYQKALSRLLSMIRVVLNRQCGIESNRPAVNQQRDELIVAIKRSKRHLSYAQVAREYAKNAGEEIVPKLVERIYKRRCNAEVEELIKVWRPDLEMEWILKLFNVKICCGHDGEAKTDK
jgi:hypothetical protein